MYLKAFFTKTTLWSVAAFCLLVGVFVYATIDRTVYVTEELVVIHDSVVSDTWIGVENILISDISEDSLYQEFAPSNAAVLDLNLMNSNQPEETSGNDSNTSEDTTGEAPVAPEETGGETEDVPTEVEETSSVPVEEVEEVVDEPVVEETPEPAPEPEPAGAELPVEETTEEVVDEPVVEEEVVTEVETQSETDGTELIEEGEAVPTDETEEVLTDEETEAETEEVTSEELTEEGVVNEGEEEVFEEEVVTTIYDVCVGNEECKLYSTTFTGFSVPEFEEGK